MDTRFSLRFRFNESTSPQVQALLSSIDEYKGYWSAFNQLSPEYLGNLQRSVIISSTGSSTRIEGSKLTDEQIEQMIYERNIRKLATRDEQEVSGYIELIKDVFTEPKAIPFSEGTIKQFHSITLKYSDKDQAHRGKYKTASNRVEMITPEGKSLGVIFDPTPPHLVQKEMLEIIEWTKHAFQEKRFHPLLIISNFIFEYLSIHPFKDGNGRTSRILTNLLLLQHGYDFVPYVSHEKIIEQRKADYYIALRRSTKFWKTDNENITDWLIFFLQVVQEQGKQAQALTRKEQTELLLSPEQMKIWQCFLLGGEWSRKTLSEKSGVNLKTTEQAIKRLQQMKKIQRIGKGRATRYKMS